MHIGYARVSTQDQDLSLQYDALKQAQCDKFYEDKASGAHASRDGLTLALETVREGDCLVVWKLDRLGRNVKDWKRPAGKDALEAANAKWMIPKLQLQSDYCRTV